MASAANHVQFRYDDSLFGLDQYYVITARCLIGARDNAGLDLLVGVWLMQYVSYFGLV